MNHWVTQRFRQCFGRLPPRVKSRARTAFKRLQSSETVPGLRLKRINARLPVVSVRISRDYRALAYQEGDALIWFWIGNHSDYEQTIATLR